MTETVAELQLKLKQARELITDMRKHIRDDDTAALLALSVIRAALR